MFKIIGKVLLGIFVLLIADYWLRGIALESVQSKVRAEIRQAENVVDLFENPAPVSKIAEIQALSGIIGSRQLAEDKFSIVLDMFKGPPPEGVEMLVNGGTASNRNYYTYPVKACGANVCPFDINEMVEVTEEFFDSYRTSPPNCIYKPARWGIIYGFKVRYCTQENGMGELIKGDIVIVTYPRNPFDVWYAQLSNSNPPYGKSHLLYKTTFVLGIETFVGSK